jgi:hypothetical protein
MSINASVLSALPALILAGAMPVTLSNLTPGPQSHVRLTNTASQPVTAWSLAITTKTSDGRSHREVETADGYLSEITHGLPGADERLERLMPGQSRDITLGSLPDGATADIVAVVLEDGTAYGDDQFLSPIFEKRMKERDALKSVVDAFDAVVPASHGTAAVDALRSRLAPLAQNTDALPCRAALDAVQSVAKKTDAADIDKSLQNYASFVKKEYDLAVKAASRR